MCSIGWGYACDVIAPSLLPQRSGVHCQHDTRDAADLARLVRAGELVAVRIPSEADERVRDVMRCRETFQREILKSRHYLRSFWRGAGSCFGRAPIGVRRTSSGCSISPPMARLSVHSAMVLATEFVDWRRFEHPGQLACDIGLIPREDSSGDRQRLASITKAGNSHCRHVLVQAAWSYRHRPQTRVDLQRDRKSVV